MIHNLKETDQEERLLSGRVGGRMGEIIKIIVCSHTKWGTRTQLEETIGGEKLKANKMLVPDGTFRSRKKKL